MEKAMNTNLVSKTARALAIAAALFIPFGLPGAATAQVNQQVTPATIIAATPCKSSPLYQTVWELTARNIYDVQSLDQWEEKQHEFDCVMKTADDAMTYSRLLMVMVRDSYTEFLDPDDVRQWKMSLSGEDAGVGIAFPSDFGNTIGIMSPTVDKIPIGSVVPGSPADKAKIVAGDWLLAINGAPVSKIEFASIFSLLDGAPGTKVSITIAHGDVVSKVDLVRETTEIKAVPVVEMLSDSLGYLKLTNLAQDSVSDEVNAAMGKLDRARTVILDLRDNPGGVLDNDYLVAPVFIEEGGIVTVSQRMDSDPANPDYATTKVSVVGDRLETSVTDKLTGETKTSYKKRQPYLLNHRHIIVLVNGRTASAAEILVGAILDNDVSRGGKEHVIVLGTTTFGKGIGQSLIQGLPDGCWIKVTSLRYLTPRGYWPGDGQQNKHGIQPTYPVAAEGGKTDNQLATALLLGTFLEHAR
jgi:carboxyl-terminal processing protease